LIARRTKASETWVVPFPLPKGVAFLDEDFTITDFLKFGLQQWNQSTSHMRQQASTITVAENIEEMDSPEAMEEDPLWEDAAPYGEKDANTRMMPLPICMSPSHKLCIYIFVMR
jgi:hypothetical protein